MSHGTWHRDSGASDREDKGTRFLDKVTDATGLCAFDSPKNPNAERERSTDGVLAWDWESNVSEELKAELTTGVCVYRDC